MTFLMKSRCLISLFALLTCQHCFAEEAGRMSDEEFFRGAQNKILILEYEDPFNSGLGRKLAELNGRLALATIQGVESFAVITLQQDEKHLALTTETVDKLATKQRTPVVIWGEFYDQNGKVFITSHLRYVASAAQDRPLGITCDVTRLSIPDKPSLRALAPTRQVNFAPIEVSRDSLTALSSFWQQSLVLHAEPKEDSPEVGKLPPETAHFVLEAAGDWTRLKVENGNSGWVRLTEFVRRAEFSDFAAVVLYAQGMTQYLAGNRKAAISTFNEYLDRYATRQDAMNQASAHVLLGFCHFLEKASPAEDSSAPAIRQFDQAARLLPNSASPINCKTLALFQKATGDAVIATEEVRKLERELIHVIQTENDLDAVANLEALYYLPGAAGYFKDVAADFQAVRTKRVEQLRRIKRQFRPE